MTNTDGVDYQVIKTAAEARIRNHFAACIAERQLEFLTLYICDQDH